MTTTFLPIQIIFALFFIFAVSRVLFRLKDGALTLKNFLFWTTLWLLGIIGVVKPELTSIIANKLGINRGSDVVIYASIMLLFYLIFRTNVMLENLRHDLTKLVRMFALSEKKK